MKTKSGIPKWPHAFFRWYCRAERYEELHGDLEELYNERLLEFGGATARWLYVMDVIRCCRPYAWRKTEAVKNSNLLMIGNYLKTSRRSLMKNPLSAFINLVGLSVAIGVCTLVYGFIEWDNKIDQFHQNKHNVYLSTFLSERDGTMRQYGRTPAALGEMLRDDFAHVRKMCRIKNGHVVVKVEDNVFHERVQYVDADYLKIFSFPLKWGTTESLSDVNSIVLSEDMAIKYFGTDNPVGKDVMLRFVERGKVFKVGGVAKSFPKVASFRFDFLVNFENLRIADPGFDFDSWSTFVDATLIQIEDPSEANRVQQSMKKYSTLQNEAQDEWVISSFVLEPLAGLYHKGSTLRDDIAGDYADDNAMSKVFLAVIGMFMLALACLNYVNIAIVSAAKRLKEIALRKVIGANRGMVIMQFLGENFLLTSFALVLGLVMGATVFIPSFEQMNHFNMEFNPLDSHLLIFLTATLLFTGMASGLYPALYISRFQAVTIFKGSIQFGKKNPLTKIFLGFQLILACMLIASAVMFTQNASYVAERSWGYDQARVLYAEVADRSAFEQLDAAMARDPDVLSVTGSAQHIGKSHVTSIIQLPPVRKYEVDQISVDARYLETMGLQLQEGRFFSDHSEGDKTTVVVNQQLVNDLNLDQPISGQVLEIDGIRYEVIGVVRDFHSYNFYNQIEPTIFTMADKSSYRYLTLKVNDGKNDEVFSTLQQHWTNLFPEIPFQGGHQEEVWGGYFEEIGVHGWFWRGIATLAVVLAGLGLYGLVTLNVSGRRREFSIRKVLGAKLSEIASSILKPYVILFIIALIIGAPVSYILVEFIFDLAYIYHLPMNPIGTILASCLLILVLFTVVAAQVGNVSKANPVIGLRLEQ